MKDFSDIKINKRKESKDEFEKGFKFMCNATYGRILLNLRKRRNISLIDDTTELNDFVKKPDFISFKILFNENLVAVHNIKQKLYMDQPIYVGISIVDLSKYHMYNFHYGFIKNEYGSDSKLLFTDTDSSCYGITTEDFYLESRHV